MRTYWLEVDFSLFLHLVVFLLQSRRKKTKKQITESQCGTSVGVVRCPKKSLCQCFLFFFFFIISCFWFMPSTTFPPLSFLDTDKPKCFLASGLKICWSVCNFAKENEIKNCQSLLQCCCRHPPLPLCHTASHVRVHAQTANVIPTSPQLCFASSKAVVFPPGMSRRFLFHRHTVKFTTPLHPDNLTKSPLCVVYQPRKLSYASKRYNGLGPNAGAWSVKLLGNSLCGFRRYVTMFFSPPSWFSW